MNEFTIPYKGIIITYEYGFYSPSIDPSVCEMKLERIMDWIDKILGEMKPKYEIDGVILADYHIRKWTMRN